LIPMVSYLVAFKGKSGDSKSRPLHVHIAISCYDWSSEDWLLISRGTSNSKRLSSPFAQGRAIFYLSSDSRAASSLPAAYAAN
jgi:hypothetical protein